MAIHLMPDLRDRHVQSIARNDGSLDVFDVAGLPDQVIRQMTREEMARVIRVAPSGYLRPDVNESLDLYDTGTLERLVFLARRACRNRIHCSQQGTPDPNGGRSADWGFVD